MSVKFSNNAVTTLSAGISVGATSFNVSSASLFPTLASGDWTYVSLTSEVVKVTAISGTTFTCDATSAAHASGESVELRMTAELLNDFAEDTEALPKTGGAMTGAITTNSTFDGRDVATDGTKLDTIATSANNYSHPANHAISVTTGLQAALDSKAPLASPALTGVPTAPTAAANTNTTQVATTAYVQTEVTDLIGGAPGTLDTLNELAAAINDDASYASTLTTALGTKTAKTSNQSLSSAANAMTISGHTITLNRGDSTTDTVTVPDNNTTYSVGDGGLTQVNFTTADNTKLDGIEAGATADQTAAQILTAVKTVDGSGSGLDADLLDGIQGSQFIRSDTSDVATGPLYVDGGTKGLIVVGSSAKNADDYDAERPTLQLRDGMYPHLTLDSRLNNAGAVSTNTTHGPVFSFVSALGSTGFRRWGMATAAKDAGALSFGYWDNNNNPHYSSGGNAGYTSTGSKMWLATSGVLSTTAQGTLWGSSNDGSGSGLDADTVDGIQGASILQKSGGTMTGSLNVNQGAIHFQEANSNQGDHSYAIFQEGGAWSHPYPDLRIAYHTGIKIGAHKNYNGTRFYNNSDMVTLLLSVGNGNNDVSATGNITAYASDERLKHKFKPIDNALDKLSKINGVTYEWNPEACEKAGFCAYSSKVESGLKAQEIQKVLPEVVSLAPFDTTDGVDKKSKSGEDYLTIDYARITPLLIEAIKEQQTQIDELKALVQTLIK